MNPGAVPKMTETQETSWKRMLTVGWSCESGKWGWYVYGPNGYKYNPIGGPGFFCGRSPAAALRAVEKWYKENGK